MKLSKIIITCALILSSISVSAQIKKPSEFSKAEIDTTSYLMGVNFGSFIRSYNFTHVDYDKVNEFRNKALSVNDKVKYEKNCIICSFN